MSLAWGGQINGEIAGSLLKPAVNFVPLYAGVNVAAQSNLLMAAAADQWASLAYEFQDSFGRPLNGSEFYRAYGRQKLLYADWLTYRKVLAAYPRTSNHGWARSVDIGSNVGTRSSAEHQWVAKWAPRRGFNFTVASEGWHVDYGTASVAPIAYADGKLGGVGGDITMSKPHILRNTKTGSVDVVDVLSGLDYHVPAPAYIDAWEKFLGTKSEDTADNWHGYWRQVALFARQQLAQEVWNTQAKGFNGTTTMGNRLLGIDQYKEELSAAAVSKIVSALPKTGTAAIDVAALTKALTPSITAALAPALAKDLGARISNG